jgi:pimeloyl-ACP methyl ester carboxylesterase
VLPATGNTVAPDPLFLLADGPGQAATEAFLPVLSAFERINHKRDVVLVDQRGTGKSHSLRCLQNQLQEYLSAELTFQVGAAK